MPFMPLAVANFIDANNRKKKPIPKPCFWFYWDEPFEFYAAKYGYTEEERFEKEQTYYADLWGYSAYNRPFTLIFWCTGSSTQDWVSQWALRRMRKKYGFAAKNKIPS